MKKALLNILVIISSLFSAQNHKTIDSINAIPFEDKLKNSEKLVNVFYKNLQNAKEINYPLGEAESYSNLSLVSYFQGKYDRDLKYSLQAISIFEKLNEKEKLAREYGELGFRMKLRNMEKAQYYMQKAKKMGQDHQMKITLAGIYDNYGVLKKMQKQYDSAIVFFKKSLSIKEETKDSIGIPYSLNNIGEIYRIKNQFHSAKLLLNRALLIRVLKKDEFGMIESYQALGDLYFNLKDYQMAIRFFEQSLEKSQKLKFTNQIASNYQKISECYENMEKPDNALKYYKLWSKAKESILNQDTNSKIAELEIKFETNKKEKQLLQKQIEIKNTRNNLITVSSIGFLLGLIGLLVYRQQKHKNAQEKREFQLKSAISEIENQNKLREQRLSISRDLHDNIGAQLTFVISSIDSVKLRNTGIGSDMNSQLNKISNFTKETITELRDTIWAMNSQELQMDDFYIRLVNFMNNAISSKNEIEFQFSVSEDLQKVKFSSVVGINLYRTIQEAINNAIKYSEAKHILLEIKSQDEEIKLKIKDDGKGFCINTTEIGNGLFNMKKRIEEIDGICNIHSDIGQGTTIEIVLPKNKIV